MANVLYSSGRQGFLDGSIDWDTAVIKCILLRGYTFDDTDVFVSDLSGATQVSTTAALGSKTVTSGVADAADSSWSSVTAGAACNNFVIVQSSAVTGGSDVADSAKRLIAFIDSYTGLPVTPNGANITLAFDNGANKIFKL